jgi:hypothetical protein
MPGWILAVPRVSGNHAAVLPPGNGRCPPTLWQGTPTSDRELDPAYTTWNRPSPNARLPSRRCHREVYRGRMRMDLLSLLSRAGEAGKTGSRDILPVGALVMLIIGLVAAGVPGRPPAIAQAWSAAEHLSGVGFGLLVLIIVGSSIFLQPLVSYVGGVLQGKADWGLLRTLAIRKRWRYERKRHVLVKRLDAYYNDQSKHWNPDELEGLANQIRRFPQRQKAKPTLLGNIIAAAEEDAGGRYGLDTSVVLPRLEPVLQSKVAEALNAARDDLNFAVRFVVILLLAALSSFALILQYPPWYIIPIVSLILAWLSYRNAIAAAVRYGEALRVAFDLDRFRFYAAIHVPLPNDDVEERHVGQKIVEWLWTGRTDRMTFEHVGTGEAPRGEE